QADRALHALLSGNPVRLTVQPGEPPALVLESPDGSRSSWTGEPTAETRYGTAGELVFLEVAPVKVDCNHPLVPGHQCLQVREVHYDDAGLRQPGTGEWQPLYARIEGFEFVEGERKILRVRHFVDGAAPADAPAVAYVLDMVVESERVAPADGPAGTPSPRRRAELARRQVLVQRVLPVHLRLGQDVAVHRAQQVAAGEARREAGQVRVQREQ